jgi:hypothetical protein
MYILRDGQHVKHVIDPPLMLGKKNADSFTFGARTADPHQVHKSSLLPCLFLYRHIISYLYSFTDSLNHSPCIVRLLSPLLPLIHPGLRTIRGNGRTMRKNPLLVSVILYPSKSLKLSQFVLTWVSGRCNALQIEVQQTADSDGSHGHSARNRRM